MARKSSPKPPDASSIDPLHQQLCEKIRSARSDLGWTLQQLGAASGVSPSMISQIERGLANPTLAVAYRLAHALGLSLGDLVDSQEPEKRVEVIRSHDPQFLFRDDKACRVRTLSPLHLEKDVEFYQVSLKAHGTMESAPHFRHTREFLTVEKGTLELTVGEEIQKLKQGDSAHYPADLPHALRNLGKGEAVVFLVVIYSGRSPAN
jgi:transcriptional regulator with XRE-family HTH domain